MTTTSALARLRVELKNLQAYAVPDASGMVKLDAMENPYSWPKSLRSSWFQQLNQVELNRYPNPDPAELKNKLQQQFGPEDDIGIILGNGSDELIQLLTLAVAKPNACMLALKPSFSMYHMIADMVGIKCQTVALNQNFDIDLTATLTAIERFDPALMFIAFPNNPTGNLWSKKDIRKIVKASNGLVVIDEAYGPFASQSFAQEMHEYENMLLLRTASKLGLAGIRFGWLTGSKNLIAELNKLRLPYNINQLTQLTMDFVLNNYADFAEQAKQICNSRRSLCLSLNDLDGVQAFPSDANFILFKILSLGADEVFQKLLAQKVLIKNLSSQDGLQQCLRVTVGTDKENEIFLQALRNALVS